MHTGYQQSDNIFVLKSTQGALLVKIIHFKQYIPNMHRKNILTIQGKTFWQFKYRQHFKTFPYGDSH